MTTEHIAPGLIRHYLLDGPADRRGRPRADFTPAKRKSGGQLGDRAGSAIRRVEAWFVANHDDTLTLADLIVKFDLNTSNAKHIVRMLKATGVIEARDGVLGRKAERP